MPNSIEIVRNHNKTLAFSKINDAVSKIYLACCLSSLGGVVLGIVQRLTHKQAPVLNSVAVDLSLAPVLIAHLFIYINSSNFYETYYMVWDRRQLDRLLSLLLWLLHPFVLVMSLIYPAYWLLWLALLVFAVFIKNAIARAHEPADSPARTLLTKWLKRAIFHLVGATVAGCIVFAISSNWIYKNLGVDLQRSDVKLLINFQRGMLNWIIVVLVGLASLTRLQPAEDFPVQEVQAYQDTMSVYLDKELSRKPDAGNPAAEKPQL